MKCTKLTGSQRKNHLDIVWEMYVKTYGTIGMHLNSPQDLLDYDLWELCGDPFCTFFLWKVTKYGLKMGLVGSDGTSEGKSLVKSGMRVFKKPARYVEVSKSLESLSERLPAVCSSFVSKVLGKNVRLDDDGVHYFRPIGSLGLQRKILVGKPIGIPTTSINQPSCPL